jgi:[acyl-carrier-protein] S-malonyltransferase
MTAAVVFPGQGAHRAEMAQPWLEHPVSAALFADASEVLGYDVALACRRESALADTRIAQPAIFVCGLAGFTILTKQGFRPVAAAGHSLGEFAALVAAGAVDFADALDVVRLRAEAMADAARENPGAMTAVIGVNASAHASAAVEVARAPRDGRSDQDVLVVANDNGPRQVVLSGTVPAVARAETVIRERGGRTLRLAVAGAFHSPLMASAAARVAAAIDQLTWSAPRIAVVPNVTGEPTRDAGVLAQQLRRHLLAPVQWHRTVRVLASLGTTRIVECGPTRVLGPLVHQAVPDIETAFVRGPEDALAPHGPVRAQAA